MFPKADAPATAATVRERGRLDGVDVEDTTAPLIRSVCVWSGCSGRPDMGEVPLCFDHYYTVINHWRAPAKRRAEAKDKLDRGGKLTTSDPAPGWLYYVQVGDLIKIGYAQNVRARLTAYPPNTVLLAVEPGTRRLERERHLNFRPFLAEGREWYRADAELMEWVAKVRAEHGDPGEHEFKMQKAGPRQTMRKRTRARVV